MLGCWNGRRPRRVDPPLVSAPQYIQYIVLHLLVAVPSPQSVPPVCSVPPVPLLPLLPSLICLTLHYSVRCQYPALLYICLWLACVACLQRTAGPWAQLHRERADTAESAVLHQVQDSTDGVRTGPHRNPYQ